MLSSFAPWFSQTITQTCCSLQCFLGQLSESRHVCVPNLPQLLQAFALFRHEPYGNCLKFSAGSRFANRTTTVRLITTCLEATWRQLLFVQTPPRKNIIYDDADEIVLTVNCPERFPLPLRPGVVASHRRVFPWHVVVLLKSKQKHSAQLAAPALLSWVLAVCFLLPPLPCLAQPLLLPSPCISLHICRKALGAAQLWAGPRDPHEKMRMCVFEGGERGRESDADRKAGNTSCWLKLFFYFNPCLSHCTDTTVLCSRLFVKVLVSGSLIRLHTRVHNIAKLLELRRRRWIQFTVKALMMHSLLLEARGYLYIWVFIDFFLRELN